MQLFWRQGYSATSVDDLSGALHLSRSSLYATFGDKRTLFLKALTLYSERVIGRTAQTLKEAPTPLAGVQALFDAVTSEVDSEAGYLGCFMVNSVAELVPYDPDVTAIAAAYSTSFQRLLAETLAHATQQQLVGGKQTPTQLAAFLFNALQGMRILIKSGATHEQVSAASLLTLKILE